MVSLQHFDPHTAFVPSSRKQSPRPVAWDVRPLRALRPERAPAPVVPLRPRFADMDDVELLGHVVRGQNAAWAVFFERFRGLILSCALKVAIRSGARLSSDDLGDVLGEVTLNMVAHDYRRLRSYRVEGGCSVASWVGVIATSTTRDHLRRARRHRLEPIADAEIERRACPNDGPEEQLVELERRAFVDRALSEFSPRDREFVELYFAEARPPEEIAESMGVSLSTVYSKKTKIKTRLKNLAAQIA